MKNGQDAITLKQQQFRNWNSDFRHQTFLPDKSTSILLMEFGEFGIFDAPPSIFSASLLSFFLRNHGYFHFSV